MSETIANPNAPSRIVAPAAALGARWGWWLAALIVVLGLACSATVTNEHVLNWGGWTLAWKFLRSALHPVLDAELLRLTGTSALATIAFALCGSFLSLMIGAVGGLLASEAWWEVVAAGSKRRLRLSRWPPRLVRGAFAVPRGIHELVWGLFLINVLGLDPFVAVLAIGIPFGAITTKVFAEMIDETPRSTALRLRALGANSGVAFAYGILPRAIPLLLSYSLYRLECAIRSAAVLGLIGAGGLGYQMMLSLQSLRYEEVWTFLYALIILIGVVDAGSSRLTAGLRGHSASSAAQLHRQARSVALVAAAATLATLASYWYLNIDLAKPFEPVRLEMLWRTLSESLPPRFNPAELLVLARLSVETLAMSIVAIAMAGAAAIVASWVATPVLFSSARRPTSGDRWARRYLSFTFAMLVRGLLVSFRALSDGIWALLALFMFFPGPFTGAVALGAYNFGVLGRLLAQVNESANTRPYWALRAQGASMSRAILYGLLPSVFPKYLAYILYRWEVCVRATVVVGIVGAGGLGLRLEEQMASFDYRGVAATLVFYVGLTVLADSTSSTVRRALRLG